MRQENNPEMDPEELSRTLAGRLAGLVRAVHEERDPLRRALLAQAFREPLNMDRLFPEKELALAPMPRDGRERPRAPTADGGRMRAARGNQARTSRAGGRKPLVLFVALGGQVDYAFRAMRAGSPTSITMECGLLGCVSVP